jgi:hypothetical protein
VAASRQQHVLPAQGWFPREPVLMPLTEMTVVEGHYDYPLTLLWIPEAEWQSAYHDDEVPLEDPFGHFIRNGQYPF